jgi:DNA gyrase inhibitor GyrI
MEGNLVVELQEMPSMNVVYLTYRPEKEDENTFDEIASCFNRLTELAMREGFDVERPRIGIPVTSQRGLVSYDCCIEVHVTGFDGGQGLSFKAVPGGSYCVLVMEKDSKVIGDSIGRFYQEYVPRHRLCIDPGRPVIEFYTKDTMRYCVPVIINEDD